MPLGLSPLSNTPFCSVNLRATTESLRFLDFFQLPMKELIVKYSDLLNVLTSAPKNYARVPPLSLLSRDRDGFCHLSRHP